MVFSLPGPSPFSWGPSLLDEAVQDADKTPMGVLAVLLGLFHTSACFWALLHSSLQLHLYRKALKANKKGAQKWTLRCSTSDYWQQRRRRIIHWLLLRLCGLKKSAQHLPFLNKLQKQETISRNCHFNKLYFLLFLELSAGLSEALSIGHIFLFFILKLWSSAASTSFCDWVSSKC